MAKKSSGTTKDTSAPKAAVKKAVVKKAVVKKAVVKKTAVKKAPVKKVEAVVKKTAPKAAVKKSAPTAVKTTTKKPAPKKAAPKLNDRQVEFLKKISGAGLDGYAPGKGEDKTLLALSTRKLVKRGKKNPSTGKHHYMVTKAGQKHSGAPAAPAGA